MSIFGSSPDDFGALIADIGHSSLVATSLRRLTDAEADLATVLDRFQRVMETIADDLGEGLLAAYEWTRSPSEAKYHSLVWALGEPKQQAQLTLKPERPRAW